MEGRTNGRAKAGRSGWLGLTPQWTFTSYPLPACPGALGLLGHNRMEFEDTAERRSRRIDPLWYRAMIGRE